MAHPVKDRPNVTVKCHGCHEEFIVTRHEQMRAYCSPPCRADAHKRRMEGRRLKKRKEQYVI